MSDIKVLIKKAKRMLPEDVIFQDREYYSCISKSIDLRKRQLDLGKLINNLDRILEMDPNNEVRTRAIWRYFIVLLDSEKYHLNYRECRRELLDRYKDLIGYI